MQCFTEVQLWTHFQSSAKNRSNTSDKKFGKDLNKKDLKYNYCIFPLKAVIFGALSWKNTEVINYMWTYNAQ